MKLSIFCGRLTADIQIKQIGEKGSKVAEFSLAVDDSKETEFYDFKAWNGKAEILSKYVKKGDMLLVTTEPKQEKYENGKGEKRKRYFFVVNEIQLLGKHNVSSEVNSND
jgi:single stranded DNA-binding protein